MLFLDLLKSVDKEKVLSYLEKKDGEKYVTEYSKMIDNLLNMTPSTKDLKIYIVFQKEYSDGSDYISVLGYSKKDNESYALEFMKWSEWLGCGVIMKSVEHFGPICFVSECLSEMSFISFDENNIQGELDNLNKISERLKNGEEKTYTMEEVFEHLNEKFDLDLQVHERTKEEEEKDRIRMEELISYNEQRKKEMTDSV